MLEAQPLLLSSWSSPPFESLSPLHLPGGVEPEPEAVAEVEPEPDVLDAAQSRCSSPRPQLLDEPEPLAVALEPLIEDVQPQVEPPDVLALDVADPLAHPPLPLEPNLPDPLLLLNATPGSVAESDEPGMRSGEQDATVNTSTPTAAATATATFMFG